MAVRIRFGSENGRLKSKLLVLSTLKPCFKEHHDWFKSEDNVKGKQVNFISWWSSLGEGLFPMGLACLVFSAKRVFYPPGFLLKRSHNHKRTLEVCFFPPENYDNTFRAKQALAARTLVCT